MKIDIVIPKLHLGGSERQVTGLALGLARAGHDVCVVTVRSGGVLTEELQRHNVSIRSLDVLHEQRARWGVSLNTLFLPVSVLRLARFWSVRKPHVIQAWLPEAQIIALPLAAALRIGQRIMSIRSMTEALRLSPAKRLLLRIATRASTAVTANCIAILNDWGWSVQKREQHLIYNAVSIPARTADSGRQPARGIVVANLTPVKGHRSLLEALTLLDDPPDFTFVGSGPERDELKKFLLEYGLEDSVTFVEGISDPTPLLSEAQFFVLPSYTEGLPNAIMEAMASGLPTVAFRVGGIPEIVDDGETGILVDPGDVQGLASAIQKVADDPEWRALAGLKAAARVKSFDWEAFVQANIDVMNSGSLSRQKMSQGDGFEDW